MLNDLENHLFKNISIKENDEINSIEKNIIELINKKISIPHITHEEKEEILKNYLVLIKSSNNFSWIYKFIIPLLLTILIILIINHKMRKEISKRKKDEKELLNYANRDSLTNIFNRGKINLLIDDEITKSKPDNKPFSIIFFDIDNFKLINDHFGHVKGDEVLVQISNLVSKNIRETDFIGRWGGEEFIILLPETSSNEAFIIANDLRVLVSKTNFGINNTLTISLGISQYSQKDTKNDLIKRADDAMYFIKNQSKNAVKVL
ncbi:GGDEF domain-containing protein [Arcobacter peruensis]|uniref:GGDEF domain-containing protein n=1 Tax=Arcobacter peruensis TaxID=2320140 RepID=UPI0013E0C446|nr:GGDEF domain-containing protein [Arcobacter peruensis]